MNHSVAIDSSVRYPGAHRFAQLRRLNGAPHGPTTPYFASVLRTLDANRVEQAFVIDESAAESRRVIDGCAASGARLIAVPRLEIGDDPKRTLARLRELVDMGARHLVLSRLGDHRDPLLSVKASGLPARPVWQAARRLRLALFVRPTVHDAILLPYYVAAFPEVIVVVEASLVSRIPRRESRDNLGRPRSGCVMPSMDRYTLWGLSRYPSVRVVLSSEYAFSACDWPYPDLSGWHSYENFVDLFGAERLMWGSDFPYTWTVPGYARCLARLREMAPRLTQRERAHMLRGTAHALATLA